MMASLYGVPLRFLMVLLLLLPQYIYIYILYCMAATASVVAAANIS